jgi:hypothetical protein
VVGTGVVVAEGPVELTVGFGRVVDAALLSGVLLRGTVVDFALFAFAIHPMEFCVGSFLLTASLRGVDRGSWRQEVRLFEIPVGVRRR